MEIAAKRNLCDPPASSRPENKCRREKKQKPHKQSEKKRMNKENLE